MKKCTRCKETKPTEAFYMQEGYPSGMCRKCYSAYQNLRNREKREIRRLINKESLST